MAGASEVRAGGAYVEIGAKLAPLKKALSAARTALKGFSGAAKTAARATVAVAGKMVAAFKKVAGAIAGAARRVKDFAVAWGKRAIVGLVATLGLAAKEAIVFESAMADVATVAGQGAEGIKKLSSGVLALAGKIGKSPQRLAKALYQAVSAGVDASKVMDFLGVAAKSAAAGMSDTFVAVDALTSIINSYGMEAKDAMDVSDILFTTIKNGKTTYDQLGASIGRVTPIAAAVGVSFDQIGAAMGTLTKGGLSTDEAVTALRATFMAVLKPNESAVKKAKELGIEWNVAALRAKGLTQFLFDLKDAIKGDTKALGDFVPNTRAITGVLSLVGPQAKEFARQMDSMATRAGATDAAFKIVSKTVKHKLSLALNSTRASLVKIGNVVMPIVAKAATNMAERFGKVADWIDKHSDKIKTTIGAVWDWINKKTDEAKTLLQPVIDALKKSIDKDWLETWASAMKWVGGAWDWIKDKTGKAKTLLQPVIDALKKAAAGDWAGAWADVKDMMRSALNKILELAIEYAPKFVDFGLDLLTDLMDALTGKNEKGKSIIGQVSELIGTLVGHLVVAVAENADKIIAVGVDIGYQIVKGIAIGIAKAPWNMVKKLLAKRSEEVGRIMGEMGSEELPKEAIEPRFISEEMKVDPRTGNIVPRAATTPTGWPGMPAPSMSAARGTPEDQSMLLGTGITINNLYKQTDTDIRQQAAAAALMSKRGRL